MLDLNNIGLPDASTNLNGKETVIVIGACLLTYIVEKAIEKGYNVSVKIKDGIEFNAVRGKKVV